MEVRKESNGLKNSMVTREELAIINQFTKRALKEDEVYTFAVRLCDNEVDRDGERFPRATLEELAELFVGKSGIFDHEWTAKGQAARIYRTEIVEEEGVCSQGEGRCYLKGYAYMLRGGENDALIAQIEGGIKKEVSVGCSIRESRCSICQSERTLQDCGHRKGEWYEGRLCHTVLHGAEDAYEWSFVAVPAQRQAGVVKESRLESQQRTVQKLWQAGEEGSGMWIDREEACQMKRMMKNLMEDCEDARRMARKELLQKAAGEQMDERASEELWEVLELLSIRQMKALGKLIDNRQTMEQPQLAGRRAQSGRAEDGFVI